LARAIEEIEAENFGDDKSGIAGAVHAIIGEVVRRDALSVERAKTGFIAEEWTPGHGHTARKKRFDGSIEPNDGNPLGAQKFRCALLCVGAASEGQHDRLFHFSGAAKDGAKLFCFKGAEGGFTEAFEKFRDAKAGGILDAIVKVDKAPGELASEKRADS